MSLLWKSLRRLSSYLRLGDPVKDLMSWVKETISKALGPTVRVIIQDPVSDQEIARMEAEVTDLGVEVDRIASLKARADLWRR